MLTENASTVKKLPDISFHRLKPVKAHASTAGRQPWSLR
jgi:hypothetical protein